MAKHFCEMIAKSFPGFKGILAQAGVKKTPAQYVKKSLVFAFYLSAAATITFFLVSQKTGFPIFAVPISGIGLFVLMFLYRMKYPSVKIKKRMSLLDKDLLYAGRHLLIELESGVPLFEAIQGITRDYGEVSKQMDLVVQKVNLGVPLHDALQQIAEVNPSSAFRRVIWQIVNSLRAGSDVSIALESILDQVAKEQMIEVRRYGQKLNPIAMLYMMLSVIMPTLGITLLIVMSSFLPLDIGNIIFVVVIIGLIMVQLVFMSIIKSMRPAVEM